MKERDPCEESERKQTRRKNLDCVGRKWNVFLRALLMPSCCLGLCRPIFSLVPVKSLNVLQRVLVMSDSGVVWDNIYIFSLPSSPTCCDAVNVIVKRNNGPGLFMKMGLLVDWLAFNVNILLVFTHLFLGKLQE